MTFPGPSARASIRRLGAAGLLAVALAWPGAGPALTLPDDAQQVAALTDAPSRYGVAVGPAAPGAATPVPKLFLQGPRQRDVWQIPAGSATSSDIYQQLQQQLQNDGWEVLFACAAADCGGFDFRFALPVVSMPAMFVDIAAFQYLSARRPAEASESGSDMPPEALISVLVSPGAGLIHVQTTTISRVDLPAPVPVATADPDAPDLATALRQTGSVTLEGLSFAPGSTELTETRHPMLDQAAALLSAAPDLRMAVVGHTDTTGSLDANLAVSRARAQSVADRLAAAPGVDPAQVSAHGVGFLAPRGPNTTEEERSRNRRVDLIWIDGSLPDLPAAGAP